MIELDKELDIKMAELMGWKRLSVYSWRSPDGHRYLPKFSGDIAAAMQVVEEMRKRGICIIIVPQKDDYLVTASEYQPQFNVYRHQHGLRADSFEKLPEIICQVILLAVEAIISG